MNRGEETRTMAIERVIAAPLTLVWNLWWNPQTLPLWWGPAGFTCRTTRIRLEEGGEWLFDMIGPDGTVYANHHLYHGIIEGRQIGYHLLAGENGPLHAEATARFEDLDNRATRIRLSMVFASEEECRNARAFGAEALGLQTLDKLARLAEARP